jgi:glyoxylase-like metal-dependent hydrolase (beta-lactamase superfamily II)
MKIWSSPAGRLALAIAASCGSAAALAQGTPYENINAEAARAAITVEKLRGNVSMLQGSGGNITVLAGSQGAFMVDAGIAVSRDGIAAALRRLTPARLRYVVTTHWHWDHADGNSWARAAGATVIAHRQAVRRLKQTIRVPEWQHTFTPNGAEVLPNRPINAALTISLNGEQVLVRPYEFPGHTDGDLSVYFAKADVLAVGDTFWNGHYPFLDYVGGGGIDTAIIAADANIAMAKANTIVVPGHGPAGTRADLVAFRDMLVAVRTRVHNLKVDGMSLEEVVAARPTAPFDARWGTSIIGGDLFAALVYRGA